MTRQHLSRRMPSSDRLAARRFELVAAEYVQRIGARIAARRVEQGLSQVDIARALPGKVDGSQVSRWERGLHRPSDDTLERMGEILDVPVAYFMAAEPTKDETPDLFPQQPDGDIEARLTRIEGMLTLLLQKAGVQDVEEESRRALMDLGRFAAREELGAEDVPVSTPARVGRSRRAAE